MGTKSRDTIYGGSIRASAERAAEARKQADRLACEALTAQFAERVAKISASAEQYALNRKPF